MKTLKSVWPWACLVAFFVMVAVSAQTTNAPAGPSSVILTDTDLLTLLISVLTPFCVRGLAKLGVPPRLLPLTTPLIGCAIGAALNWIADAGLGGLDMAKAGALAVAIREAWDQNIARALREPTKDDWQKLDETLERTDNKNKTDL